MKPFYFAKRKHREGAPQSLKTKSRLALQLAPVAIILVALAISIPLSAQTITTFDAPGAGTGALQGTRALAINPSGTITGFYCDAVGCHGFLRVPDGTITSLDPPGSVFSEALAINSRGVVTGAFYDASGVLHGFVYLP